MKFNDGQCEARAAWLAQTFTERGWPPNGRQGAPYALSFFRVPHLDLMILQRERLSR